MESEPRALQNSVLKLSDSGTPLSGLSAQRMPGGLTVGGNLSLLEAASPSRAFYVC